MNQAIRDRFEVHSAKPIGGEGEQVKVKILYWNDHSLQSVTVSEPRHERGIGTAEVLEGRGSGGEVKLIRRGGKRYINFAQSPRLVLV